MFIGIKTATRDFFDSGDSEIADELLHSLDNSITGKWVNRVEALGYKSSSRHAWSFVRKLGDDKPAIRQNLVNNSKNIGSHTVLISNDTNSMESKTSIRKELKRLETDYQAESQFSQLLSVVRWMLQSTKPRHKRYLAVTTYNAEFLTHIDKHARLWQSKLFTNILDTGQLPERLKQNKIITNLKPSKTG